MEAALPANIDLVSLENSNGKCILLMAIFFEEMLSLVSEVELSYEYVGLEIGQTVTCSA